MLLTKKQATSRGQKLLKKMKGKGWKLRVHENNGWHYNVWTAQLPCTLHPTEHFGA